MNLRLVASSDSRALEIRDHLLPLVRKCGGLQVQHGPVRLIAWRTGKWSIDHWTPFNDVLPGEASSPGYRHAIERQRMRQDLPYGMDIAHEGARVLRLLWADDGTFVVVDFRRGPWEDLAMTL